MEELFDMDFPGFLTVRLVKISFVLSIAIFGLIAPDIFVAGFKMTNYYVGTGILIIVLAPTVFFFGVIYMIIILELPEKLRMSSSV